MPPLGVTPRGSVGAPRQAAGSEQENFWVGSISHSSSGVKKPAAGLSWGTMPWRGGQAGNETPLCVEGSVPGDGEKEGGALPVWHPQRAGRGDAAGQLLGV